MPEYWAVLEPIAWVLRVETPGKTKAEGTYAGVATITVDDAGIACIRGMVIRGQIDFTKSMWQGIAQRCKDEGFKALDFTRLIGGKERLFRIDLLTMTVRKRPPM